MGTSGDLTKAAFDRTVSARLRRGRNEEEEAGDSTDTSLDRQRDWLGVSEGQCTLIRSRKRSDEGPQAQNVRPAPTDPLARSGATFPRLSHGKSR